MWPVASLAVRALKWKRDSQSEDKTKDDQDARLLHAMSYSAVRLTHLLLFDSRNPQVLMLNVFYMQNGVESFFRWVLVILLACRVKGALDECMLW